MAKVYFVTVMHKESREKEQRFPKPQVACSIHAGGVIPGTRSKARKPLWHKEPPAGPLKQSHATFNYGYPHSIWAVGFNGGISNQELVDFACEGG